MRHKRRGRRRAEGENTKRLCLGEETGFCSLTSLESLVPPHDGERDVLLPAVGLQRHTDTCWSGRELAQNITAYTMETLLNYLTKTPYVFM